MIIALIKSREAYKKIIGDVLLTRHQQFDNTDLNSIDFDISLRQPQNKFIGLKNYGCTCYLNSLIQQLFMIGQFRKTIYELSVDYENQNLESNPLYQLQLLFANLSHTLKLYHTPMHFIKSFSKAFNNETINVSQQQDCEEFLNILIDNLESAIKGTKNVKVKLHNV